jgi:hypothetical protein
MTRNVLRRALRRVSDTAGTNLVEAAIITPLLLLLTLSIVDFASIFYVYLALENGVSQASRYGVTGTLKEDPDNPGEFLSQEESIRTAMREATPTLAIEDDAFTFSHIPAGEADWVAGVGGPSEIAKVSVNYTWSLMTPLIRPFFDNGEINVTVESAMKNETRWDE